jgi:hypothetical protein
MNGFIPSQCVFYLMQIHIQERTLWLTRHGESEYNIDSRVGGDPPLTERGSRYAKAMNEFVKARYPPAVDGFHIWTSTLMRTMASVAGLESLEYDVKHMRFLNEISAGICDNLTYVCFACTFDPLVLLSYAFVVLVSYRRRLRKYILSFGRRGMRINSSFDTRDLAASRIWMSLSVSDRS